MNNQMIDAREMLARRRLDALSLGGASEITVEEIDAVLSAYNPDERLIKALEFYANPEIYKPHPHGPAFDRRDLSFRAKEALSPLPQGDD